MSMRSGFRNRSPFSQIEEMIKADRYTIRLFPLTIRRTRKRLLSIAYLSLMKTVIRKQESEKVKELNISGRRYRSRQTIGTNTRKRNFGDRLGRNTVTDISNRKNGSITEAMHGRGEIRFRLSTKALLQDRWKWKGRLPTDARSTERSGNGTLSNNRSGK